MKDINHILNDLGFKGHEAKVFLALLNLQEASGREIAEEAGIIRTSVYPILSDFIKRGYCVELKSKGRTTFSIVRQELLKKIIEDEKKKSFKKQRDEIDALFYNIIPKIDRKKLRGETSAAKILRGDDWHIRFFIGELLRNVKKEVLLINKLSNYYAVREEDLDTKYYKKNILYRSIYEDDRVEKIKVKGKWLEQTPESVMKLYDFFHEQGEEIRIINKVKVPMMIFDRKTVYTALLGESKSPVQRTNILIHSENYAAYITELFEVLWRKAVPLADYKKESLRQRLQLA